MKKTTLSLLALAAVCAVNAQVTVTAKTSFGVNGWIAPNSSLSWLESTSLTRSLAYNKATGNVLVLGRAAPNGPTVYSLNGQTGAQVNALNNAGFSGGTFTASTVGVSDDGQVFVANLTTNASTSPFRIYHWASEAAGAAGTPTAYNGTGLAAFRLGDSFDVRGSGSNVEIVAGYSGTPGYAYFQFNGASLTSFSNNAAGLGSNGDYRLGITFLESGQVMGKQTSGVSFNGRYSTYAGGVATGVGTPAFSLGGEAAMDYAEVNGRKLLATIEMGTAAGTAGTGGYLGSTVRIYDVTDPNAPVVLTASGVTTIPTGTALAGNGNGTGSVAWGGFTTNLDGTVTADLYAMTTNQGIQAFQVNVVPEPGTLAALGLGAAALIRRRRKASK